PFRTITQMKNPTAKLLAISLLSALALATGCSKQSSTASDSSDADDNSAGSLETRIDKHGEEIMAGNAKAQARAWMKDPSHVFFKANAKQVAQYVEAFYSAGATQVYIADIEEHDGKQFGESLLVVLPKDSAARAKLFEIESGAATTFDDDPVSDKGQK